MIKTITRGGQTIKHNITMTMQIVWLLLFISVASFIVSFLTYAYFASNDEMYYATKKWGEAAIRDKMSSLPFFTNNTFFLLDGHLDELEYNGAIIKANEFSQHVNTSLLQRNVSSLLFQSLICAIVAVTFINALIFWLLRWRGRKIIDDKSIRGAVRASPDEVIKILKSRNIRSGYTCGGLPIVKGSEVQHIALIGTTGTGKTVSISDILSQVRKKKQKAVIYDCTGVYTERFYREGKDIVLNLFDKRMPYWSIFLECQKKPDFDLIANAAMPEAANKDAEFWLNAARTLFSAAGNEMRLRGEFDDHKLLRYLLTADFAQISELVKNTEAESLATEKSDKLALSVKAVLSTYLKGFQYIPSLKDAPSAKEQFSIRNWVENSSDDSWVFVTTHARYHETLRPVISTWMELVSSSICSLKRSADRRIFIAMDELPTLHKLPSLTQTAAVGRNYGVSLILGAQSFPQFYKYYGEHAAKEVINLCNTMMVFRANEYDTARYVSMILGEQEREIINENISYGANSMRDGISVGSHRQVTPIVLPSEIQYLDDLQAFVKLKGNVPVTKITLKYKHYPLSSSAFIERELNLDHELSKMFKEDNEMKQKLPVFEELSEVKNSELVKTSSQSQKHQESRHKSIRSLDELEMDDLD